MQSNVYFTNSKHVVVGDQVFSRSDLTNHLISTETVDETIEKLKQEVIAFFDKMQEEHTTQNILPSSIEIRLIIS